MSVFNPYEDTLNLPFFIAEIGINHNGELETTKSLIMQAKAAGCNAVKFQKRDIDTVYTEEYLSSARQSPWGTTQRDQKQGLEFGEEEKKAVLSNKLYQEGQALLEAELNLKYFDLFPLDENTGVRRRSIEEKIDKNKGMIKLLKEELK